MPIEGFDYNAFANDLASQAMQILQQQSGAAPDTLSDADKNGIIETIKKFCLMSGEALSNDPQIKLNAMQASLITQFIGEWTFHKSIDLINSKIAPENREAILQIIAANIFNTAKLAIIKNMPQEQLISLVETKVTQVYNEELQKLVKKGVLTPEQGNEAANRSNLNDMVQKSREAEEAAKANPQNENTAAPGNKLDAKSLKFAAIAIVLQRIENEQAQEILKAFGEENSKLITDYMQMSDLESKTDPSLMLKALEEIKKLIPPPDTSNIQNVLKRFYKIIKKTPQSVLNKISLKERENVRDFILDANFPAADVFAPLVLSSVAKSIENKINDY